MKPYLIHLTDIFHPHGDPDDHFDLAAVFALHSLGKAELKYVVCDYPPPHRIGDPALCAVAQLNEITGSDVIGTVAPKDDAKAGHKLLSIMREADRPVSFSVVGSTASLASAIREDPNLFREKCEGIYLCAGTGIETEGGDLEYNVRLHPSAFATVFTAPCPIYWFPCYSTITPQREEGGAWGSVYCILQKELLPKLAPRMQNYFLYMLTRSQDPRFLRYLDYPVDENALHEHGEGKRRLWSTAALLTVGGIACNTFEFLPVRVNCREDGHMQWEKCEDSRIKLFHILRDDRIDAHSADMSGSYREEMLEKLTLLLQSLS